MTARDIYNSCVENETYRICLEVELKKHASLAKAYPKGYLHYYRQAMWEIQNKLKDHTFFIGWSRLEYGRMFGENGANSNVFDWVDNWMREEYDEASGCGLNAEACRKLYAGVQKRYTKMFTSFLIYYESFHWLNKQLNEAIIEAEWIKCLRSDSKIIKAYLTIEEELYAQGYIKDNCWVKDIATLQELLGTLRENRYFQNDIRGGKSLHTLVQARMRIEDKDLCRLEASRIDDIMANIKRKRRLKSVKIKPQ